MTSYEFPVLPARPSDAERDRAIDVLKENAARGRLSHDTFIRRMELALTARARNELHALTADLPADPATGWAVRMVDASAAFTQRIRRTWRSALLPQLMLPDAGPHPLRIGRDPGCGLRLADDSVSRSHAEVRVDGAGWLLRDLGSMNGTWVNGVRLVGEARVRPGDTVRFGRSAYRLAGR